MNSPDPGSTQSGPPQPGLAAWRERLFVALALRTGLTGAAAMAAALEACRADPSCSVAQALIATGAATEEDCEAIERLVERMVRRHGFDCEATLATLESEGQAAQTISLIQLAGSTIDAMAAANTLEAGRVEAARLPQALGGSGGSPPSTYPTPQQTIPFGDYELLERIAQGGMGVVYRARQVKLNRIVALKMILAGQLATEADVQRFYGEAEAAAQLDHPGIVPVYEVGEHAGQHFFSMGFVQGQSLAKRLAEGPLPPRRAAELARKVAEAVAYAHQRGVIHRDLKPGNILLDQEGQPRITDFGLAKHVHAEAVGAASDPPTGGGSSVDRQGLTLTGQILGTPSYMPPEQARGSASVGPLADVYSLGAVLYALLTGRPPFQAASTMDILRAVLEQEPVSPRRLNAAVDRDLETICLKCLEKEPGRRYRSARELADDLERYLNREPIRARPIGRLGRAWRWCRRKPVQALLLALLASSLIAGAAVSSWFGVASHYDAIRAAKSAEEAKTARDETKQKLRASLLAQAQAGRAGAQMGRRFDGLRAVAEAAEIRPGVDLRNEAIACMALVDLRVAKEWEGCPGDSSEITCIIFDSRLERYAHSDAQGNISVRRVADDNELMVLPGQGQPAWTMQFSPNGELLAATYHPAAQPTLHRAVLWDLTRGTKRCDFPSPANGYVMDFSPDGRLLALGHGTAGMAIRHPDALVIYDTATGQAVQRMPGSFAATAVCFHPQGHQFVVAVGSRIWIKDVTSGQTLFTTSLDFINDLAWHPHGTHLAAAHIGRITLLDMRTLMPKPVETQGKVRSILFNRSGDLLATTTHEGALSLRNPWTGKKLLELANVHQRGPWGKHSQFGPDDKLFGYGINGTKIQLWQVARPREFIQLYGAAVSVAAIHPEGRLVAVYDSLRVGLWDLAHGKPLGFFDAPFVQSLHFHPGGESLIVSQQSALSRWPLKLVREAASERFELGPGETLARSSNGIGQAASTPDGKWLAVTTKPKGLLINWDDPRQQLPLEGHYNMSYVSVSPDGTWIATGAADADGVAIWDGRTGKFIRHLPDRLYNARVEFSPDGRWLLTSQERQYRLWEVGTWKPGRPFRRNGGPPGPMAFSPDGQILALAPGSDVVQIIDLKSGDEIATLTPPDRRPFDALCFSRDSTRLAVAATEGAQVWDLRAIREQLRPMGLDWDLASYPPDERAGTAPPVIKLEVLDAVYFDARANEHALHERWPQARTDSLKALEIDGSLWRAWYTHAMVLLASGDEQAYRQVCLQVLQRFHSDLPWGNAARLLALRPGAVPEHQAPNLRLLIQRSRLEVVTRAVHENVGALLYRLGDYPAAIERLKQAIPRSSDGVLADKGPRELRDEDASFWIRVFLAMAYHQTKQPSEAQRWLAMAERSVQRTEKSAATGEFVLPWHVRLSHRLLLAEARELIGVASRPQ